MATTSKQELELIRLAQQMNPANKPSPPGRVTNPVSSTPPTNATPPSSRRMSGGGGDGNSSPPQVPLYPSSSSSLRMKKPPSGSRHASTSSHNSILQQQQQHQQQSVLESSSFHSNVSSAHNESFEGDETVQQLVMDDIPTNINNNSTERSTLLFSQDDIDAAQTSTTTTTKSRLGSITKSASRRRFLSGLRGGGGGGGTGGGDGNNNDTSREGRSSQDDGRATSSYLDPSPEEQRRLLDRGIRSFNLDPTKGLRLLQEKRVIPFRRGEEVSNAIGVARFLMDTRGLNKIQIGVVLGDENCKLVLTQYLNMFDFSSCTCDVEGIETGLRRVLKHFKPPGEAQKIDRVLYAFADKFHRDQLERMDMELIHSVAYSIVLLNVDLHNPANTRRMTREQFVKNAGSILHFAVPPESLQRLFDNVTESEIKHVQDREDVTGNLFTAPDMSGWLDIRGFRSKRSGKALRAVTPWRRRWFMLSSSNLYFFKESTDVDFAGFIPLENVHISTEMLRSPSSRFSVYSRQTSQRSSFTDPSYVMSGGGGGTSSMMENTSATNTGGIGGDGSVEGTRGGQTADEETLFSQDERGGGDRTTTNGLHGLSWWQWCFPIASWCRIHKTINIGKTHQSSGSLRGAPRVSKNQSTLVLLPMDNRLLLKTAKMGKRGEIRMVQHHWIALRANSRTERDEWVRVLNQKGMLNESMLLFGRQDSNTPAAAAAQRAFSSARLAAAGPSSSSRSTSLPMLDEQGGGGERLKSWPKRFLSGFSPSFSHKAFFTSPRSYNNPLPPPSQQVSSVGGGGEKVTSIGGGGPDDGAGGHASIPVPIPLIPNRQALPVIVGVDVLSEEGAAQQQLALA